MNDCTQAIKTFLSDHTPNYADTDIHSLLEFLWHQYTEHNPICNEEIRGQFEALKPVFDSLSYELAELLFDTVINLCSQYERQTFLEGIQVGARLFQELCGKQDAP